MHNGVSGAATALPASSLEARLGREAGGIRRALGVDIGYGFVKVSDAEKDFVFPSVVGVGQALRYRSEVGFQRKQTENLAISLDDRLYFVGDLAIRQSGIASRSLDQNRAGDQNVRVLLSAALSLFAQWDHQDFQVVTGLPVNYYAAYRDAWESQLRGEYVVRIHADGQAREKHITLSRLRVVPQPFGTLYHRVLNSIGNLEDRELAKRTVGIVDIGFKTTDFAVADQLEFIDRLSGSTDIGLSTAYGFIADWLREELKVDKETWEVDEIVSAGAVRIAGKPHDISRLKYESFARVAQKIIIELESLWDYRDLDLILITGGGGQALAHFLLDRYPNIQLVDNAQLANVRGYAKLAHYLFGSMTPAERQGE